jgi:predicted RNA binding protein YcfA (HicA-like mRNA interferase family)
MRSEVKTCARSKSRCSVVPKIPGVNHLTAVRALEKAGFRVARQGKHIVMSNGQRILTIPRHNPVNAITMGGIVRDAGLTVDEFRTLL